MDGWRDARHLGEHGGVALLQHVLQLLVGRRPTGCTGGDEDRLDARLHDHYRSSIETY